MTNYKTISSLVSFYTAELQNEIRTNLTFHLEDYGSVSGNSGVSKELSNLGGECLQYIKSDVQAIVCEVLDVDKTYLYMYGDKDLDAIQLAEIDKKIARYKSGEPLAYILGYKYFWGQKLKVTQDTLIPRADTEILVQAVLDGIAGSKLFIFGTSTSLSDLGKSCSKLRVLDLGTGTGAIALALAGELPNAEIVAVDYSAKALEVAKENATSNGISTVEFVQSDWYRNLDGRKFHIIVSNPPYIDSDDNDIDAEVKAYEPASALFAEDNGLADIEIIVSQARCFLKSKGRLYIEHGHTQSASVQGIFEKHGFVSIKAIKDLNGKDRCTVAKLDLLKR